MKLQILSCNLNMLVVEAKQIPGMRIGQYVVNELLAGTALGGPLAAPLFYCDDSEFWTTVQDFVEII
ncbi:MAG: hypothetical protein MJA29_11145 [Candidatus Omnitrophica bacterium]|nr:hypothetical protein [Candidatus Omnitrophota bacterium]